MAITNKIENFHMEVNQPFLDKAEALAPALITTEIRPAGVVEIVPRGQDYAVRQVGRGFEQSRPLGRGDSVCLDLGDHWVGYVSFTLAPVGSPQDAPPASACGSARSPMSSPWGWRTTRGRSAPPGSRKS